ncbi:MAG: ATP-dependent DNA helicase RecG [Actinomycetaceae bacterium]|nr:ATP-dependent DNA helicase RecG [Actinomycetaceae bacterium]
MMGNVMSEENKVVSNEEESSRGLSAVRSDGYTVFTTPLEKILGDKTAQAFHSLKITTVEDLLFHFPFRVAERGKLVPLESVEEGEDVTVIARIIGANLRQGYGRGVSILTVKIADGVKNIDVNFFAKNYQTLLWHKNNLPRGATAIFSGKTKSYRGQLQLTHPDYELLSSANVSELEFMRPIPIYHATTKFPSWRIQKAVDVIMPMVSDISDPLPFAYREEHHLPSKMEAIRRLHQPETVEEWHQARKRMAHEEAFVLQTILAARAHEKKNIHVQGYETNELLDFFDKQLPFELTEGQKSIGEDISRDLASTVPMNRLLQGDVGSGKTLIAMRAMLQVVGSGGQAVLLAPTEVLARQHYEKMKELLGARLYDNSRPRDEQKGAVKVELFIGALKEKEKKAALARMASGESALIVATHAVFSSNVILPFLGLVVVDEQHRFGVEQRAALGNTHTLMMSATPIPRSIAMSYFADIDISNLHELPKGRAPIETIFVPSYSKTWVERMWQRAREEIDNGGRVYVVVSRIDENQNEEQSSPFAHAINEFIPLDGESEKKHLASVIQLADELQKMPIFAGISVSSMHGKLSPQEKQKVMDDFSSGRSPLMVSTTVIEVGVDVPEATLMIIMDADRFGLAQLHQLRGRIGRGSRSGLCLVVSDVVDGTIAYERIQTFVKTRDGFVLAQKDLELRSEGNILGHEQSGRRSNMRFLNVVRDGAVIESAREWATRVVDQDPLLGNHEVLRAEIEKIEVENQEFLGKV